VGLQQDGGFKNQLMRSQCYVYFWEKSLFQLCPGD